MRQKKNSAKQAKTKRISETKKSQKRSSQNPFLKIFKRKKYLESALTHPSYSNGSSTGDKNHFERLEYLGDSVLGFVIAGKLFRNYPQFREGKLTHLKSHLVSRKELSNRALKVKLHKWIKTSNHGKNLNPKILADSLEALIGALYLDRGIKAAEDFINKLFPEKDLLKKNSKEIKNPKGKLQELTQKEWGVLPSYTTISHKKGFHSAVKNPYGRSVGIATNKKEAQEIAANKLLIRFIKKLETAKKKNKSKK